jgi:hypothetical protein
VTIADKNIPTVPRTFCEPNWNPQNRLRRTHYFGIQSLRLRQRLAIQLSCHPHHLFEEPSSTVFGPRYIYVSATKRVHRLHVGGDLHKRSDCETRLAPIASAKGVTLAKASARAGADEATMNKLRSLSNVALRHLAINLREDWASRRLGRAKLSGSTPREAVFERLLKFRSPCGSGEASWLRFERRAQ